jgi:glycosyltransferase involved in cell wall biosynthesis
LTVLPTTPHENIREYYWNADIVVDQFKFGCAGMISLEAIACGRPAIAYVTSEYQEYQHFPVKDLVSEEQIAEAIVEANDALWKKEYEYLMENHKPESVLERLLKVYDSVMKN